MDELIRELRVAISNILLYPPESPLVKKSLDSCYQLILEQLKTNKVLTLSESEGKILANGKPVSALGGIFLDSFKACSIKSATFKRDFTQEELRNFLHNLSEKQKLEAQKFPRISINEKLYVPVGKKDLIVERGKEFIKPQEKALGIAGDLLKLIDSITDLKTKHPIKLRIAKRLFLNDSTTLSELLKSEPKLKDKVLSELKPALPAGREEKEEKPPSLVEEKIPAEISPVLQVEALLKRDSQALLHDQESLDRIPSLLQGLHSKKALVLAGKLCDKLAVNLEHSVTDERLKAVISFKKLYSVIESLRDKKIVVRLDNKLTETERKERNGQVYQEIAGILERAANRYLKEGDYERTQTIIRLFGDHIRSGNFEERKRYAKASIDKLVGSEMTRLLVDDLSSKDEKRRQKAISVLLDVGDPCVPHLIQKIKETSEFRLRKAIADLLAKIGKQAVTTLVNELQVDTSPDFSLKILDVLYGIGFPAEVIQGLVRVLVHPSFRVRKKIIELLNQIVLSADKSSTDTAKELLLEALGDESSIIKERALELLGNLQYKPAVPKLIEILAKEEKEPVLVEVSKALGKIGDPSSVPALLKAVSPKTIFRAGKSKGVRVAALEALIKFGDKRVKNFAKDKDSLIRKIAKEAFEPAAPSQENP